MSNSSTPTGIIIIDAQATFVTTATQRNPASGIPARVAVDKAMFDLARSTSAPFFITYEAAKTGDHALTPALVGQLPPNAKEYIKTTFDATGQPDFDAAIRASGMKRFLVVGSETDVCVMQTILGLRRQGFEVVAVVDGIFTEEVNAAPALRRWKQAGVAQVTVNDAAALVAGGQTASAPHATSAAPITVKPFAIGFVLNDMGSLGSDPSASAKQVRLKQLLLVSEWFQIPIFAQNPAAATSALSATLRQIMTKPIQPLSSVPSNITQLAISGASSTAVSAAATLGSSGKDVFLLEDILFGATSATLEPAYEAGAVPSTYKTLYYELIHSVDDAGWPSQQWVADGKTKGYYNATLAPEELAPIPGR